MTRGNVQDIAGIEKLHSQDVAATLSGDSTALSELWTDDIVRLQQGQEAEVGKRALLAAEERHRAAYPGFRVLSYVPEIKDVTVVRTSSRVRAFQCHRRDAARGGGREGYFHALQVEGKQYVSVISGHTLVTYGLRD